MSNRPDLIPDLARQLERLAELSADDQTPTDELPLAALMLQSGHRISGRIFHATAERVLVGEGTGTTFTTVLTNNIVALSFDNGPETDSLFGLTTQREGATPSRLQLKRTVKTMAAKLHSRLGREFVITVPWDDMSDGDVARGDLAGIIEELDKALDGLTGDDLGLEALKDINSIVVQRAEHVGVSVVGATIEISLNERADRVLGPVDLTAAIDAAL